MLIVYFDMHMCVEYCDTTNCPSDDIKSSREGGGKANLHKNLQITCHINYKQLIS